MKRWIAYQMRKYADRIDHEGAPHGTHFSFTYERRVGTRLRTDGRGARVWTYGRDSRDRAWAESDTDWSTTLGPTAPPPPEGCADPSGPYARKTS